MSLDFKRYAPHPGTLLSALLIVLAFPPWNYTHLIWLSLVPWFFALNQSSSLRRSFREGVWLSVLMSLGGFYWVATVLKNFSGLPLPICILGFFLYTFIGQPQFYFSAPFFFLAKRFRPSILTGVLLASIYAGIDWFLPKLFVDTLGHSFYASYGIRQVADLGGATLLTFLVFLFCYSVWQFITQVKTRTEPSAWPAISKSAPAFATSIVLIALGYFYGDMREKQISQLIAQPTSKVQMAVIQANIGDFDKIAAERGYRGAADKVMQTYFGLSDQALGLSPKPEILVWPETSYPSTFRTPQTPEELARDHILEKFVRDRGITLLFGGYDHYQKKDYNAFFYLSHKPDPSLPGEGDLAIYRKNILLLFGEYIPGAETIKYFRDTFPQVGNFGRGEGPQVVKAGPIQTGPIICYEALFPNYILGAARKGSQLILNITNDSWFGQYGEPELHLALTTFRSIESRLPQLRATNTGISALILPNGDITQPTALFEPAVLNVTVPIYPKVQSLMLLLGDWFGPFALILGILGFAARYQRSRARNN